MKINRARGSISTILILSGFLSLITGVILYFMKYGMWLCFTRKFLNDTHVISGLIMCLAMIIHLVLNRRIYLMEMQAFLSKRK